MREWEAESAQKQGQCLGAGVASPPAADRQQRPTAASEHLGLLEKGFWCHQDEGGVFIPLSFPEPLFCSYFQNTVAPKIAPSMQRLFRLPKGSLLNK